MSSLILYLGLMLVGYLLANKLPVNPKRFHFLPKLMMFTVYVLLLLMGLRMGVNEQIISNLGIIGLQAFIITLFCLIGSIIAVYVLRVAFKMNRFGYAKEHTTKEVQSPVDTSTPDSQLKSTFIILILVAMGMLIGHFIITAYFPDSLTSFNNFTGEVLHILLCMIVFVVGFDLGLSGNIVESIQLAGIKILIFPIAAILGTLLFGAAAGLVLGFSFKEGLVISAGFGWYSYAPNVILAAGEEYVIISAVSFMHNVIREIAGIILIPVVSKKIGYIEATALPGVSATDICIPLIERYCQPDTVIYSFITGIFMCIATSVLVPLLMSI